MTKPSDKSAIEAAEKHADGTYSRIEEIDWVRCRDAFLAGMEEQRARDAERLKAAEALIGKMGDIVKRCKCTLGMEDGRVVKLFDEALEELAKFRSGK
jgi:hypothetical protein